MFCPYPSKFAPKKSFPSLLTAGAGHFLNTQTSHCTTSGAHLGAQRSRDLWAWDHGRKPRVVVVVDPPIWEKSSNFDKEYPSRVGVKVKRTICLSFAFPYRGWYGMITYPTFEKESFLFPAKGRYVSLLGSSERVKKSNSGDVWFVNFWSPDRWSPFKPLQVVTYTFTKNCQEMIVNLGKDKTPKQYKQKKTSHNGGEYR